MRVARLFLFADWPEKYFSGQSEGRISNASGTRSVRVSAQGLSRSCCKLSPMKIPLSRLAAPGSPRMGNSVLSIYCFFFVFLFLETLNCSVCCWEGWGVGGREIKGILHLALLCQCLCYLANIFVFLEGEVIKVIVQKGYI